MYACMYVCLSVCMYVFMYAHTHTHATHACTNLHIGTDGRDVADKPLLHHHHGNQDERHWEQAAKHEHVPVSQVAQ